MVKLYIISIATNVTDQLHAFYLSFSDHVDGIHPTVLGMGQKWTGHGFLINQVVSFCKQLVQERDSLVVIVDAYDLLCNGKMWSVSDLIQKFNHLTNSDHNKVVVGAERYCGPNCVSGVYEKTRYLTTGKLFYPNGGFVMGTIAQVYTLYTHIQTICPDDDQFAIGMVMNASHPVVPIVLDHDGDIIYNCDRIDDLDDITFHDGRFILPSGKVPYFIHTPNIYIDKGRRYNYFTKKLAPTSSGKPRIDPDTWFLNYVIKASCDMCNPVYRKIWVPIVVMVCLSVVIICLYIRSRKIYKQRIQSGVHIL